VVAAVGWKFCPFRPVKAIFLLAAPGIAVFLKACDRGLKTFRQQAGGNHLPDWVIARPVFVDGTLVAFTCNRAHQSDIGGGAAGTYNPQATEIFHEGIRLPVLKLVERGRLRRDLMRLLLLNSRCPDLMEGDLSAMQGSIRIGGERVVAMLTELGVDAGLSYFDALLRHGEARMRAEIRALPSSTTSAKTAATPTASRRSDAVRVTHRSGATKWCSTSRQFAADLGFKNSSLANTYSWSMWRCRF
jgi:N-methylhydantoinase B